MAKVVRYRFYLFLAGCASVGLVVSCAGVKRVPPMDAYRSEVGEREERVPGHYTMPQGILKKNKQGIWELYVAGDPLERGLTNGILTRELLHHQEEAFVSQLDELVPSRFSQWLLRGFLKFFNRQLLDHVPEEYQVEIYGLSQAASDRFDFIAPPYPRLLYFHGAHDIGHALQDLALVGCTSFAAWGTHTADGKLLVGRNFDFYAGDAFSEEKLIAFIRPDSGYNHAMVTWAGMVGAVSGMNEKGLTVTINAGKSDIPLTAKTPISLLAREILQYAGTLEQAIRIAQQREVFVSESILVGSAADGRAILIEVSPKKFGVYETGSQDDLVVCANHFQSQPYQSDKRNVKQLAESHSKYRFDRMHELIEEAPPLTPVQAAAVLRNREGMGNAPLGYGNEKAINQLLAHHAVIFQPEDLRLWVSANPYQLGAFVAYDLDKVFEQLASGDGGAVLANEALTIPLDPFVHSRAFENYQRFRIHMRNIQEALDGGTPVDDAEVAQFLESNPDFWKTNFLAGEYAFKQGRYAEALHHFREAASKEVTTERDRRLIEKRMKKCKNK